MKRFVSTMITENADRFLVKYRSQLYDLRDFLKNHPGGRKALEHFQNLSLDKAFEDVPHSEGAFNIFQDFALNDRGREEAVDNLVDWNAPILSQVGHLKERYWEWINLPVNRPIRFFASDFLEYLTVTPWYLVPIVWFPACIYFIYLGITIAPDNAVRLITESLTSFAIGVLLWTGTEYFIHRIVFHSRPPDNSRILITLHFLFHGAHHKAPFDGQRLVLPPFVSITVGMMIWRLYATIFPVTTAPFVAAGTVAGYLAYDIVHYYLHNGAPKFGTFLYTMKRNHNYHHFLHHDQGFGVSSKIWDYMFGSEVVLRPLKKPIEW